MLAYPSRGGERSQWIRERRGPKNPVNARQPHAYFVEPELASDGLIKKVATIFLTNSECPWRCAMCDLWRNTTNEPVESGDIIAQIEFALARLPTASNLKLYNAGSFFDARAIPARARLDIARVCGQFHEIIVECHPALVTEQAVGFQKLLSGKLQVAMGLETAHPAALEKLNKRITLSDYARAAAYLKKREIGLRTFLLVGSPFISQARQEEWVRLSIDFAFDRGSDVVSLIPARSGNGALEALELLGEFREPAIKDLEQAQEYGLMLRRGGVFADVWDLERFSNCADCFMLRRERLTASNLTQKIQPKVICPACGE